MIRIDIRLRLLAICLAALAGYVDALGYLSLGGFFVSFMSGNSTRLGIGLGTLPSAALIASSLVAAFVGGVVIGSTIAHYLSRHPATAVMLVVAAILAGAAGAGSAGSEHVATLMMAVAMGAENAVFQHDGEIRIGVTYMTGTLVKMGQRLAAALRGGDRVEWIWYLLLWSGLVAGAVAGSVIYQRHGLQGLWLAVIAAIALAAGCYERRPVITATADEARA